MHAGEETIRGGAQNAWKPGELTSSFDLKKFTISQVP